MHSSGTTYYLSLSGDDASAGTDPSTPWQTLERANRQTFGPGDRLLLKGTEIFSGNLVLRPPSQTTPARPITLGSYGEGRACIRAVTGTAIHIHNLGHVVVRDLKVTGVDCRVNDGCGVWFLNNLPDAVRLKSIRIENVEADHFGREGICIGPLSAVDQASKSGYQDVRLVQCVTHHNLRNGLIVRGYEDSLSPLYSHQDVVVEYCVAHDNLGDPTFTVGHSGSGIFLHDVDTGRIDHCLAYENGAHCGGENGGPCGIWIASARRFIIQYCIAFRNHTGNSHDGDGFDLDGGVSDSIMQYNFSSENDGAGYLLYTYRDAPHTWANNIVRYNLSINDCRKRPYYAGFYIANDGDSFRGLDLYHNTVLVGPTESGDLPRALLLRRTTAVRIFNNLLITRGGAAFAQIDGPAQPGLAIQGNAYWSSADPWVLHDSGQTYTSLNDWQAATGRETSDSQSIAQTGDPGVEPIGLDQWPFAAAHLPEFAALKLADWSPLIDSGVDLRSALSLEVGVHDFWGNPVPQGAGYDIGSFEHGALR